MARPDGESWSGLIHLAYRCVLDRAPVYHGSTGSTRQRGRTCFTVCGRSTSPTIQTWRSPELLRPPDRSPSSPYSAAFLDSFCYLGVASRTRHRCRLDHPAFDLVHAELQRGLHA